MSRKKISTGHISEQAVGYSRAIVDGDTISFSGTTSQNEHGQVIGKSVYEQTCAIFDLFDSVLQQEGFSRSDVVFLRVYLVSMDQLGQFDRAFTEYYGTIHPCCTLVGIASLVDPKLLIEIECEAVKTL
jgi:enamine deaminase RidA (YjgF/YER057c/UK114 family)